MVDHRAEDHQSFGFLTNSGAPQSWAPPGFVSQARDWVDSLLVSDPRIRAEDPATTNRSDRTRTGRLAVGVCLIWISVLAAYGFGFLSQASAVEGGVGALPALSLLFFAFAAIGPVIMIWFVVAMLNRAERLSETITGQSETALALAATINNLNDSIEELTSSTSGRLARACDRMETRTSASIQRLENALQSTSGKLDTALLDSVILLDTKLRERAETLSAQISDQQISLRQAIDENLRTIQQATKPEVDGQSDEPARHAAHPEHVELSRSLSRMAELEDQIRELLRQISATIRVDQEYSETLNDDEQTGWLFDDLPVQTRTQALGRTTVTPN